MFCEKNDDDLVYGEDKTRDIVDALIRRDGYKCFYCVEPLSEDDASKYYRTVDHYHSIDWCRKKGWPGEDVHGMANLVLAHRVCNASKSNREWLEDGTLAPRPRTRQPRTPRPDVCTTCTSGRKLLPGEKCPICNSGPQPRKSPTALKRSPTLCDHANFHCYFCFLQIVPRVRPLQLGDN